MDGPPSTRASLLVRLRDPHDERAWAEFLTIYTPLVHRLVRRKGFQEADADDVTQEVFRAVAGAIDRWDPDPARGSFRGWLFRIARNLMVNFLAGQKRHGYARGTGDTVMKDMLDARPAPPGEATAVFEAEYKRQVFLWAAEKVRGEFREATWQAFWRTGVDGQPIAEVALALNLSAGAVYVARSRVIARLRQEIEQVEGEGE